jgi:hypothetical protein
LAAAYTEVRHIDAPAVVDLWENRTVGLRASRFFWVMRCDADYVAYDNTRDPFPVAMLRERLLRWRPIWPTALFFFKPALAIDWHLTYEGPTKDASPLRYIPRTHSGSYDARIYSYSPGLTFRRLGRWEGVPHLRWYRKIRMKDPYWFECTMRSPRALFLRTARTDWREAGDFGRYPTVETFVEDQVLPRDYPGMSIDEAADAYFTRDVLPQLVPYDEVRHFPLPQRIRRRVRPSIEGSD